MAKSIYRIILFILFLDFLTPIYAVDFLPQPEEQLIFENSYENWVEDSYQPSILYQNNKFYMFHTTASNQYSSQKIGYATSVDGLHWKKIKLYDFGFSENVHSPSILKQDEKYVLTFAVDTNPNKIMSTESSNIGQFDILSLKEVVKAEGSSEVAAISDPNLFIDNNTKKLWYVGNSGGEWRIHLAYFEDNIWKKCANNPVFTYSGYGSPSFLNHDGINYLMFHSYDGIEYIQTIQNISCSTVWSEKKFLIGTSSFFPYPILINNNVYLYYTTFSNTGRTMIRSLIYKQTVKNPIILIPGLFASWNKDAIIHQKQVGQEEWKLNPIVNEYKGIEQTLENLGYEKNKNLFVFTYDWRINIESVADDLRQFIDKKNLTSSYIIGHSLGGLVGRIYIQKYNSNTVDKLITVGSPHLGAANSYSIVEAGESQNNNSFMWFAQELVINLYRDGIKTNRQIIQEKFPVAQNLFPINDFIKNNNQLISIDSMRIKNNLLSTYSAISQVNSKLITIAGNKGNTVSGYNTEGQSFLDKILDKYPDGKPVSSIFLPGDYTVTEQSSRIQNSNPSQPLEHGELIWSNSGIKTVLESLDIPYTQNDIVEGSRTFITPSLIFVMMSPAFLTVRKNNTSYDEQDGFVFIPDAESGDYQITAKGIEKGNYSILIGQLTENKSIWQRIEGEIKQKGQVNSYSLNFDKDNPKETSIGNIDELIWYLADFNKTFKNKYVEKAIFELNRSKNSKVPRVQLLLAHNFIFNAINKKINPATLAKLLNTIEKLELVYTSKVKNIDLKLYPILLQKDLVKEKGNFKKTQEKFFKTKVNTQIIQLLSVIEDKSLRAETAYKEKNYKYVEILLLSIKELLKSI